MEPKVIAAVSNVVGQPNGNAAALGFVDEVIRGDPNLYPTANVMTRLHAYKTLSENSIRAGLGYSRTICARGFIPRRDVGLNGARQARSTRHA